MGSSAVVVEAMVEGMAVIFVLAFELVEGETTVVVGM